MKRKLIAFLTVISIVIACFVFPVNAEDDVQLLANFDTTDGSWSDAALDLITGTTGNACARTIDSESDTPAIICHTWGTNYLDFSKYMKNPNAYISVQIYVSDVSETIAADALEFNSGASALRWQGFTATLKNGWNELHLKLVDAGTDEGFNPAAIDSCRLYIWGRHFTLAIDDLKLVTPAVTFAKTESIGTFDTLDGTWSDGTMSLMAGMSGNACAREVTYNGRDLSCAVICHNWGGKLLDLSSYMNDPDGYLDIQLYVSDVDQTIKDPGHVNIELSSGSLAAGTSCRWDVAGKLQTGWNHLKLKFANVSKEASFDSTAIDICRVFAYGYSFTLAVDDMKVVAPSISPIDIVAPDYGNDGFAGIDGGYYAATKDGQKTGGALAFTAYMEGLSTADGVTDFGLYVYAEGKQDSNKITLTRNNQADNTKISDYISTVIDNIAVENMGTNVYVIPYIVAEGRTFTGTAMVACANDFDQWLGAGAN